MLTQGGLSAYFNQSGKPPPMELSTENTMAGFALLLKNINPEMNSALILPKYEHPHPRLCQLNFLQVIFHKTKLGNIYKSQYPAPTITKFKTSCIQSSYWTW